MTDHLPPAEPTTSAALRPRLFSGYAIAVIKGWNVLNSSLRIQIPETPAPGF